MMRGDEVGAEAVIHQAIGSRSRKNAGNEVGVEVAIYQAIGLRSRKKLMMR